MVEWAALEMRCTGDCTGGSNPSLSAGGALKKTFRDFFRKNVSAITWTSYGAFLLCLPIISEHILKRPKRPKDSPTATIWLQLFRPNENCSQESVESTPGALIYSCYSATYVELCKRDRREEVYAKTPVFGYNRKVPWLM